MPSHQRSIGVIGATAIGVGGMVGGGIFAVLGVAAERAGGATHIAFAIAGVVAALTAFSYSRLSVRFTLRPVAADLLLHDGDDVVGWQVVHMPGLTAGSIALHREGVVFTGDGMRCDRHGRVLLPDAGLSLDPAAAVRSVERIRVLHPDPLLPGHGAPARLPHIHTTDA